MRNHSRNTVLSVALLAGSLAAGCASSPMIHAGGQGASVTVDVRNDRNTRPGTVRLAAADYVIDGLPVLSLRPTSASAEDVPDVASWTGALKPGDHVLEATLRYPPRADMGSDLSDMAFQVHERYHFRSGTGGAVRIRVEEAVQEGGSITASIDKRLGLRIREY